MGFRSGKAKGPWVGPSSGGGSSYFPLSPERVVVTDAAGLPTVGPYWDLVSGYVSIFAPPSTSEFEVSRSKVGAVSITYANLGAGAGNNVAHYLRTSSVVGRVYHEYTNAGGAVYSVGMVDSTYALSDAAGLSSSRILEFTRLGGGSNRQVSLLGASPDGFVPFNLAITRAGGLEYVFLFSLAGGSDGVFRFNVGNLGIATMQVIAVDNSVFELRTTNAVLQMLNDDSGFAQVISTVGLVLSVNANGLNGGYVDFTSDLPDHDKIWVQNDCVTWRSAYYDADFWPALVGQEGYGDIWFQELAGVRTVQFRLHIGGVDYTASLTLT